MSEVRIARVLGVRRARFIAVSMLAFATSSALFAAPPRTFELERLGGGLRLPTDMADAGESGFLVAEKNGRIVRFEGGAVRQTFLDIQDRVQTSGFESGEQGLLSFALHPQFRSNGFFFVTYTERGGDSVVSRFERRAGATTVAPDSERILLRMAQPGDDHNVDVVRFGPDGFLYIGTGDGGFQAEPRCTAQDGDSLLGKLLRIDVDRNVATPPYFGIPPSNPFAGVDTIRSEIWALGLRNPWRISFDRLTGDLYLADPGQGGSIAREEVDFEAAFSGGGRNYGWKMLEGSRCRGSSAGCGRDLEPCGSATYTSPVFEYRHGGGRCAVVGGHVYRGNAIPELDGIYIFGDFCGQLWAASTGGAGAIAMEPPLRQLVTFGEDAQGEVYALTLDGSFYRIVGGNLLEAPADTLAFVAPAGRTEETSGPFEIEVTRTGTGAGSVAARIGVGAGTAIPGQDFVLVRDTAQWADGELGGRTFVVAPVDDLAVEMDESVDFELQAVSGEINLGDPSQFTLTITDDDSPTTCMATEQMLCLNGGRFAVQVFWRTPQGREGFGTAIPITEDGGWYWFFRATNPEVFIKVLDGCTINGHFWVFAGGLTDVEIRMTVVDTESGAVRIYERSQSEPFGTIRDTQAFDQCR